MPRRISPAMIPVHDVVRLRTMQAIERPYSMTPTFGGLSTILHCWGKNPVSLSCKRMTRRSRVVW
jgi:hypothetical protein